MKTLVWISALLFTTAAFAADAPEKTQDFIDKVTVSNKFEIDTSKLAQEYGKDPAVKSFADQMIADHGKAGEEFKAALKEAGIDPPSEALDVSHTAKYAKLRLFTTENGFDAAYVKEQVAAHDQAVTLFKEYGASGPTPALKTFAEKTLPTLEHHLEMIKDIQGKLSSAASTGSSTGDSGK
jgi:putative membrane protein